jgi:glycosyltransferase involved in cell wall biosynthesis
VHLFARGGAQPPASPEIDGVRIHRRPVLPVPGLRLVFEVLAAAWQAGRRRLDVLLCFMTFNSGLLGYAAHRVGGSPFVIWQRLDSESRMHPPSWLTRLSAWLRRRAAEVWVQSESTAATLRREYARAGAQSAWQGLEPRLRILGNGVDVAPSSSDASPPAGRFLFLGRLVEQKNLFVLVEAVRRVSGLELWIAGDGPLASKLRQASAGAPIRFLGVQPHDRVDSLLHQCRALVLPSTDEGLPNVVLEALAAGRPVIATPVGAVPELVQDGVNGRLVPVNDVASLARALQELQDDSTWSRMAAATQASVARFGWPQLASRVESSLAEIVAGAERTARRP